MIGKDASRLQIYTLGRFDMAVDGQKMSWSGKMQKKPVDLLKYLVCGGAVVQENRLIDVLWPEAEGDSAHQAFKVALHRLRRMIGVQGMLSYQNGLLGLDQHIVWADYWEMGKVFHKLRTTDDQALMTPTLLEIENALALYRGPFLPGEEMPWVESCREKARSRFLILILRLGNHFETIGDWQRAAEIYLRGIDAEELAEDLYRRIMSCYLRSGCRGEAVRVYDRCRKAFAAAGLEPSRQTEAAFREIFSA